MVASGSTGKMSAVLSTLRSDFLTQGQATGQFEADFAACVGARFAVAVSNATAGLHLTMWWCP